MERESSESCLARSLDMELLDVSIPAMDQRVHTLLSEAAQCLRQGRAAKAKKLCEQAVALAPHSADAHMVLADTLAARRETDQAKRHYEKATECDKHHFGAWINYGVFMKEIGDFKNAVRCFKNAVMLDGKSTLARYNLAYALFQAEQFSDSAQAFEIFLKMEPNFAPAYHTLGVNQELAGDYDAALKSFEKSLQLEPNQARCYFRIGSVYQVLGRFEDAEPNYRKAIELSPSFGKSYAALATANRFSDEAEQNEVLDQIATALDGDELDPASRVHFHAAASKLLDQQARYDEAFQHYRAGNDIRDAAIESQHDKESELWAKLQSLYTKEFFSSKPERGDSTERPLFIVGMPRSGTTLTEQILASHPRAFGAGELEALGGALTKSARKLSGQVEYPDFLGDLSSKELAALSGDYLDHYPEEAKLFDRVTDKLPGNFAHLGTLTLMFPNAKFIYCRRNAIDNCLSCYFQNFSADLWYTFNLEKLAMYYRMHLDLMDHWRAVLPAQIFEVRYEEMTDDPEPIVRAMLEFCDLEWDDACLNFHETERAVKTASIWQVRQPMYKTSVAKWKRYEQHLGPLIEGLGEHAHT